MTRILVLALILAALFATPAFAFGDCNSEAYVRSFDDRLTGVRCEVVETFTIRFDGRTRPMRVVRPVGSGGGGDAQWISYVEQLARQVGPAMTAIGQLDIGEVTVFLSTLPHRRFHAEAGGVPECRVTFYKQGRPISVQEFIFTYAHELFHCVQDKSWINATPNAATWWREGTAEYFAHLVQQSTAFGDGFIRDFDAGSLNTSLVALEYPTVVFFFWLAQERGPRGVRAFIAGLPEREGRDAQIFALQRLMPIDAWLRFGEAYYDGRIRQPGGRAVPRPTRTVENITVGATRRVPLNTRAAYTLARRTITFDSGKTYGLELSDGSGAARTHMSEGTAGAWRAPPERVMACRQPKAFRLLTASVEGEGGNTLAVEASPRLQEEACCLVGAWRPTPAALTDTARLQNRIGPLVGPMFGLGSPSATPVCRFAGGTWELTFAADGQGRLEFKGFANQCRTRLPRGEMVTDQQTNGATTFTWRVEERATMVSYTGTTVTGLMKTSMGGRQLFRNTIPMDMPAFRTHGINYECRGDSLTIEGLYGLQARAAHTRAAAE